MVKRKLKMILCVLMVLTIGYNVYSRFKINIIGLSDLALANVEALAQYEEGELYVYEQPKTIACDLREGPWHTAAVERICEFCAVPYTCTPFPCGGN